MPPEPLGFFGWLMSCCVSDDSRVAGRDALSAAALFATGMAASGVTIYFAGVFHVL